MVLLYIRTLLKYVFFLANSASPGLPLLRTSWYRGEARNVICQNLIPFMVLACSFSNKENFGKLEGRKEGRTMILLAQM